MRTDFFVYSIDQTTLAPSTSAVKTITIADTDFIVDKIVANPLNADVRVNIRITSTGYDVFDKATAIINIAGNGTLPFELNKQNLKFNARDTIQITLQNLSTSATYNVDLSFIGRKII